MVIAFVTPLSMASTNCRREINFALSREKPFLSVILEPTDMPVGMELQLSSQRSVVRYNYPSWETFMSKILTCPGLVPCRIPEGEQTAAAAQPAAETAQPVTLTVTLPAAPPTPKEETEPASQPAPTVKAEKAAEQEADKSTEKQHLPEEKKKKTKKIRMTEEKPLMKRLRFLVIPAVIALILVFFWPHLLAIALPLLVFTLIFFLLGGGSSASCQGETGFSWGSSECNNGNLNLSGKTFSQQNQVKKYRAYRSEDMLPEQKQSQRQRRIRRSAEAGRPSDQ